MLITATDTGVGKTFVTCGLAAACSLRGYRVGVMKPVETGCPECNGTLVPEDAALLKFYSRCEAPLETLCPYRFRVPRAPWLASLEEGVKIEPCSLTAKFRNLLLSHDLTLVEGAGGLLVPICKDFNFADLAREWSLSVLLVTTAKLGTLNHTLLSLAFLRQAAVRILGYVVNIHQHTPPELVTSNIKALRELTAEPCLGLIPHREDVLLGGATLEQLASLFEAKMDWGNLEKSLGLMVRRKAP